MHAIKVFAGAVLLAALALPSRGQNLGAVTLSTSQQKIFSGQTTAAASPNSGSFPCTPTNGSPCPVPNAGQGAHMVTYVVASPCVGAFGLDIRLEASNDGVNFFAISEDAVDQPNISLQGSQLTGGLTATGYYPVIRLNLVKFSCGSGTPNLTAFYSGTSATVPTPAGVFGQALPYRKLIVENADTTAAAPSVTVTVPTGNSSGTLYVQCLTPATGAPVACPSGGSFQAVAPIADSGGMSLVLTGPNIAVTSSLQLFPIPAALTNRVAFLIVPTGGGGGVNWSMFYQINPSPQSAATGTNAPQVQTNGADPCLSTAILKLSKPINITTAVTTLIVGANGAQSIFVCGGSLTIAPSGTTADTATLEFGTGALCATGTTALTGAFGAGDLTTTTGLLPVTLPNGIIAPAGNGLCLLSAGTTVNIQGVLTYVQQ